MNLFSNLLKLLKDRRFWVGILPPFLLGALAWWVGSLFPVIGAPVVGIILGLFVGQLFGQRESWSTGVKFCAKKVLQTSIVLLGAGMSLGQVVDIGGQGLPVLIGTLVVAIGVGIPLSKKLKIEQETGLLVTYGTSICGASAIATMSQVMGAAPTAVAVSIAVIVLYNVLAALIFPFLGQALGMGFADFGLWAGTAVNDTSSVVAAATSFDTQMLASGAVIVGMSATAYAVVVKLTRTLAIIPLAIFEQWRQNRQPKPNATPKKWYQLIPVFLVLFLVAAGVRSLGIIPSTWDEPIRFLAHFGTTVAMVAVGMTSSFAAIKRAGWRPLALGGILWLLISLTSLAIQYAIAQI
ncbi:MAG: putative sulfate exporter family transporter [Actinomycetaceae bacterium]|nr:putative sulfate exporter family transporter [Actinomycetaceae bacterium]